MSVLDRVTTVAEVVAIGYLTTREQLVDAVHAAAELVARMRRPRRKCVTVPGLSGPPAAASSPQSSNAP
ncbi:hypothetical protein ABZX97_25375 [Streptomyces seoulensis]|uniref:hypothetical protein n=1 Tax=Streptomyces seoulensis TaxID=73044 RepID=UPI0033A96930